MNAIKILALALCGFKVCKAASFSNSQSLEIKPIDNSVEKEAGIVIQGLGEANGQLEQEAAPSDSNPNASLFSGILKVCDLLLNGPTVELEFVRLPTGTVSETEIFAVCPTLIQHIESLKSISETIQANEIVIAAVRMRSLVPDHVFSVMDVAQSRIKRSRQPEPENNLLNARKSQKLILDFLENLFFSLPQDQFVPSMKQIVGFNLQGNKSIDEFAAEKEAEIANKFTEAIPFITQIKETLRLSPSVSSEKLTLEKLFFIVERLGSIQIFLNIIVDDCAKSEHSQSHFANYTSLSRKMLREAIKNLVELLVTL